MQFFIIYVCYIRKCIRVVRFFCFSQCVHTKSKQRNFCFVAKPQHTSLTHVKLYMYILYIVHTNIEWGSNIYKALFVSFVWGLVLLISNVADYVIWYVILKYNTMRLVLAITKQYDLIRLGSILSVLCTLKLIMCI